MRQIKIALITALFTLMALVALAFATAVADAELAPNRKNTLGVSEVYQGRYSYLIALPKDGQVLEGKYTNIRFWPLGEPELYDVSVLFCGDVTEKFNGKLGVLAVAYETRAHAMYKQVSCHELLGVSEVSAK